MMRNVIMTFVLLINVVLLSAQENSPNYVLLNYDVQLSLEIIPELDKRKLTREKDKTLYSDIGKVQRARYTLETADHYLSKLKNVDNVVLADLDILIDKVNYVEHIPSALFPKRAIKKRCQDVPHEYFITTTSLIKKPVLKVVSNLWTIETKIKVIDKTGKEVVNQTTVLKLDKPIRRRDFEGGFDKLYRQHYDELFKMLEPYIQKGISEAVAKLKFPA